MILLGIVLLVVIVGAIWEFALTVPGFKNAMKSLDEISQSNRGEETPKTRADVLEALTAQPVESKFNSIDLSTAESTTVRFQRTDHYKWRRLMPGKQKLELFVSYESVVMGESAKDTKPEAIADADWGFKVHYQAGNAPVNVSVKARKKPVEESVFILIDEDVDKFISEEELSPRSTIRQQMDLFDPDGDKKISFEEFKQAIAKLEEQKGEKLTQAELYGFVGGQSPGQGGGGGGGQPGGQRGGGQQGGGQRGGGGFDPGAFFDRMDEDKDGKLSGEEIPDRMKERVGDMDKDADGTISKEEFLNAPRPQRGGGNRGGKPGANTGGGRPQFEDESNDKESK